MYDKAKIKNRKSKGKFAEKIAQDYLQKSGYTILTKNYRTRESEIDIVCLSPENFLCFVEVRSSDKFDPAESINPRKMKKIISGAMKFLSDTKWNGDIRFDVVLVYNVSGNFKIEHIKSAFTLDDV